MKRYSGFSHDTAFVVGIASGNSLLCSFGYDLACDISLFLEEYFECRNAQEFWNRAVAGKTVREAGLL